MWTSLSAPINGNHATKRVLALLVLLLLFQIRELQSQASSLESAPPPTKPELVVLVDINADQEKVFAVEQSLALDIVQRLGDKGFSFSLIIFGLDGLKQIESEVGTENTLSAIRGLTLEPAQKKKVASPALYAALVAGQAAFGHSASQRAILVISGGRDDLDGKRFKQIKSSLRTQKIACHVAIVSWHPLYGAKGMQVRGFYLHDLARSTHAKYVELGRNQKKVEPAVERLVERLLQGKCMPDNPRKTFLAYLSQLNTRSLIVEFKGGFTAVSGVFTISGTSESNVQLRLAGSTCVTCDLDIALPALRSFGLTTFTEAMNSVLKPAVEALMAEGHSFHADPVEEVAVLGLADGSTCLIGVLKEEIDGQPASSAIVN